MDESGLNEDGDILSLSDCFGLRVLVELEKMNEWLAGHKWGTHNDTEREDLAVENARGGGCGVRNGSGTASIEGRASSSQSESESDNAMSAGSGCLSLLRMR